MTSTLYYNTAIYKRAHTLTPHIHARVIRLSLQRMIGRGGPRSSEGEGRAGEIIVCRSVW